MKKRVLFVDDEPQVLEGLEDLLVPYRRKWEQVFVTSGAAALEQLRRKPFDVIVTDMRMPQMDGAALLGMVKELHPEAMRIVLSGQAETGIALQTTLTAHQYLEKPCDANCLVKAIDKLDDLCPLAEDDPDLRRVLGKLGQLPSRPEISMALQRELALKHFAAEEISWLIQQDIGVTTKILHLVNASFLRANRQITCIREAVDHLGHGALKELTMAGIFAGPSLDSRSLLIDELHEHASLTAEIARSILGRNPKEAEDAWVAGFLHDVGKLVLAAELPGRLAAARELGSRTRLPLWQAEQELYRVSHAKVGAYLLRLWGLPYSVTEAVAYHHTPERVLQGGLNTVTAVYVANLLAHERESNGKEANGAVLNTRRIASLGFSEEILRWREHTLELIDAKKRI